MTLRSRLVGTAIVLGALVLVSIPVGPAHANHPRFHSYDDLVDVLASWERRGVEVEVPAISREGRDIHLVKVGSGPFTIMYSNLLHANEPAGTEAFIRFVWALLGEQEPSFELRTLPGIGRESAIFRALARPDVRRALLERVTIIGFPMMDPDGLENDHASDFLANTDYTTKVTPQSAALEYAVRTYHPDLYLDSHGGPDSPEINIGLIEPAAVEPAVIAQSHRAAAITWRAATAVGAEVAYFEEHPFAISGIEGEPFDSADRVYYNALSKLLPVTQESYQLDGIPTVYTETVGLQSTAPVIGLSEGASVQEVTMAGLALDAAGLLSGERPQVLDEPARPTIVLKLDRPARNVFVTVRWTSPVQDYELVLMAGDDVLARSGPADDREFPSRKSRAVFIRRLPAGRYFLEITPLIPGLDDGAIVRAVWRTPDDRAPLRGILGPASGVALCLDEDAAYDEAMGASGSTAWLGSPRCP